MSPTNEGLPVAQALAPEAITLRIATVRGQRVLLDADLAALYEVETKRFNEAVKRNLAKFPADFMFILTAEEFDALRSQFATSNAEPDGRGGRRYLPRVFTEHGALIAATSLNCRTQPIAALLRNEYGEETASCRVYHYTQQA